MCAIAVEVTKDEEYAKADFSKFKSLRSAFKKDGWSLNVLHYF